MNLRFYRCDVCGKIIAVLPESEVPTVCCGRTMQELLPNRTDAAFEKHVPVFNMSGNTVSVRIGSMPHPMTDGHRILWVGLRTGRCCGFRELRPGDSPELSFILSDGDTVEAVYAYCNLHGLWCSEKEAES